MLFKQGNESEERIVKKRRKRERKREKDKKE